MIGERLKHNYAGSTAWILAYKLEHFDKIGLRHSDRIKMLNGSLECELRAYTLFAGKREDFKRAGGEGEEERAPRAPRPERERGPRSEKPRRFDRPRREDRREGGRRDGDRPSFSDRPRREDRREGGRPAKKNEGGLWPNDRFRYRDEEGRERIRNKRSKHIQTFSGGGDE